MSCLVRTPKIKALAEQTGTSVVITSALISLWQEENNKGIEELPTTAEFNALKIRESATAIEEKIQGIDISARSSDELGKKLTNPGNNLEIEFRGGKYKNAEHAYQTWKSGSFDQAAYDSGNRGDFKPRGTKRVNTSISFNLMQEILEAKLRQHPELIDEITMRGAEMFLERSQHNVTGDSFWESQGQNSFIKALTNAYKSVMYGELESNNIQESTSEKSEISSKLQDATKIVFKDNSTYYIKNTKVFNEKGEEIKDTKTVNKVFAKLAILKGRAVVVKDASNIQYIINDKNSIMNVEGELVTNKPEQEKKVLLELAKRRLEQIEQEKINQRAQRLANIWGAEADFSGITTLRQDYFNVLDVTKRDNRSNFVARAFSSILTKQLEKPENAGKTREEYLRESDNIDRIFNNIQNIIQNMAQKNSGTYVGNEYALMDQYFIPLCEEACNKLIITEGIAIGFEKNNSSVQKETSDIDENGNPVLVEQQDKELDGETIKDGWMTNFREVSVSQSLTKQVRAFISSLQRKDKNGVVEKDDIGMPKYLDAMYVHAELLNNLKDIVNFDDVMPILEKMKRTKPWMADMINRLQKDQDLQSAFYQCYRKDFQPYEIVITSVDKDGKYTIKTKMINSPEGYSYLLNGWAYNIESGNIITLEETGEPVNAIYDTAGNIKISIKDGKYICSPTEEAKGLISKIKRTILEKTKDNPENKVGIINSLIAEDEEFFTDVHKIAAMAGIDISSSDLKDALTTYIDPAVTNPSINLELFLNNLYTLYNTVTKNYIDWKSKPVNNGKTYSIMSNFDSTYKMIAKLINQVQEDAIESSAREGDKSYYSHVNPNYLGKLTKLIKNVQGKSEVAYKEWLQEEFGQYEWFQKNGEWLCSWVKQLAENSKKRDLWKHKVVIHQDKIEYRDLDSLEYTVMLINEFFSPKESDRAWYHVPILSDAPSAEFIQFTRESDTNVILESLADVVRQEFNRIMQVNQRGELIQNGTIKSPIANYDIEYKYDKEGNILRDSNGKAIISKIGGAEFKFFPALNTYETNGKSFLETLQEMSTNDTSSGDDIKNYIKSALQEVMEQEFQSVLNTWKALGLFDTHKVGNKTVYNNLIWDVANTEGTFEEQHALAIEQLKNYFYNSSLATSQIIEMTTTDLAFYKGMSDFQKRYKEVHAPAQRLNTKTAKYAREKERTIYIKDSEIVSSVIEDIKEVLQKKVDAHEMESITRDYIISQFENVNVADAQAYRSLSSYEAIMSMSGEWSDEQHESIQKLLDPNSDFTFDDFNRIWQTKKPYVFTQIGNESHIEGASKIKTPVQHKNSEFLLLAATRMLGDSYKSAQKLKAINVFMEKAGIDVVQFESTTKVGGQGAIDLSDISEDDFQGTIDRLSDATGIIIRKTQSEGKSSMLDQFATSKEMVDKMAAAQNLEENPDVVHSVSYEDYGIQTSTPEHIIDHEQLVGTQIRKLIMADLPAQTADGKPVLFKVNGKSFTKDELIKLYNEITTENILQSFISLRADFIKKDGTPNIEKISEELIRIVKYDKNYGQEYVRAFTLIEDPKTGKKMFNIPLYDPIISNKVQTLLNSMFKNNITKQKIKGGACIQASCYGLTKDLHMEFETDENGNRRIKSMEVYMPAYSRKFYEPLMTRKSDGTMELDFNKLPDNLKEAIGYRVPTESKYSMVAIKIKGFLPQSNGSAIMLPAEITTLSGSDFDIDKLYIMLPEFIVKDRKVNKSKVREVLKQKEAEQPGILSQIYKVFGIETEGVDLSQVLSDLIEKEVSYPENTIQQKTINMLSKTPGVVRGRSIEKVNYDFDKSAKENGKKARNNMLMDIMRSVLTNSEVASQILHPGNFDTLKKGSRIIEVLNYVKLEDLKKEKGFEKVKTIGDAIKILENKSWKDIDKIVSKLRTPINPLSPTTQIYFHHQNMTGGQMIGIYANHNANHALIQHTDLALNPAICNIKLNGKRLLSLHEQKTGLNYISNNTAEFLAASVDNVKDPVLAGLNQNSFTADMTCLLLRLGYNPIEIGLFMNQPAVIEVTNYFFKNRKNGIFSKDALEAIYKQYVTISGISAEIAGSFTSDFNSDEMAESIYEYAQDKEKSLTNATLIRQQFAVLNQLRQLLDAGDALGKEVAATRSDTQGGAAGPTIADTENKLQKINDYLDLYTVDMFTGKPTGPFLGTPVIDESPLENLSTMSENEIRDYLLKTKLPYLEAFRQLGLGGTTQLMKDFFPQFGNKFNYILSFMRASTKAKKLDVKTINSIYNDYFMYLMSRLPFFGEDSQNNVSSLDRRINFMKNFPEYFNDKVTKNPKIAEIPLIKKLVTIKANNKCPISTIAFREVGKLSPTLKEQYTRDWESLLYMGKEGEELALNLFKYCYYRNGFAFGPNTFIHLAPTAVKQAIPGYIDMLRGLTSETISPADEEFIYQYMRNHLNNRKFCAYFSEDAVTKFINDKGKVLDEVYIDAYNPNNTLSEYKAIINNEDFLPFISTSNKGKMLYYMLMDDNDGIATYRRVTPLGISNNFLEYEYGVKTYFVQSALDQQSINTVENAKEEAVPLTSEDDVKTTSVNTSTTMSIIKDTNNKTELPSTAYEYSNEELQEAEAALNAYYDSLYEGDLAADMKSNIEYFKQQQEEFGAPQFTREELEEMTSQFRDADNDTICK